MNSFYTFTIFIAFTLIAFDATFASDGYHNNTDDRIFPYLASVESPLMNPKCTAAIINIRWLLAAAECFYQKSATDCYVRVGATNRQRGGTIYTVAKINIHPKFDYQELDKNNVATFQITTEFQFNCKVQPITLAVKNYDAIDAQLVGWTADQQRFSNVRTITNEECHKSNNYPISDGSICTEETNKDGGIIITNNEMIGINSWKASYGSLVFVRIFYYRQWILDNSNEIDSNCPNTVDVAIEWKSRFPKPFLL